MGFSRQEYWSGLPFPPPGDLPNPGIKLRSPALQVDSVPAEPPGKTSLIIALTSEMGKNYVMYSEHLEHYTLNKRSVKVNIIGIYCLVGKSFEGMFFV